MHRLHAPELLDELPPTDPQAVGSRADLRRLNCLMGNAGILLRLLRRHLAKIPDCSQPLRLVELGAGDGTLLLRVAQRGGALGLAAQVILLDRQDLVAAETHGAFTALGWPMESRATDVLTWLAEPSPVVDVMMANLFLHHFPDNVLAQLLRLAAARTRLFIACEPRRSPLALLATRCLRLIGCNPVTQHDAAVSVRAGFAGHELSALWPNDTSWKIGERSAGWFSHGFFARRNA